MGWEEVASIDMTEISLSTCHRRGYHALYVARVDDLDSDLSEFDWSVDVRNERGGQRLYAYRWVRYGVGRRVPKSKRYMHQDVALRSGIDGSGLIDHRDGDGLNNTRLNLRSASPSQNLQNASRRSDNTSGFKGVGWHGQSKRWRARIRINGK